MKVLAIDIGGTKIASALIDQDLNLTERKQVSTVKEHTQETFANFIGQVINQYDPNSYEGIAVGTTGTVHNDELWALTPRSLGNLAQFPLMKTLKGYAQGKPVFAMNDAQAAAWAEYSACKKPNMCFVTVSTGIGGGLIIDGELYQGHTHLAGHIGHNLIRLPSAMTQAYGEYAIVENIASGTAIAKATDSWDTPCTTAEVFELQLKGDAKADAIIKQAAEAVAIMIANLVVTNDVHDFYLGGSVCICTNFIAQVEQVISQLPKQYHCKLFPAVYGQDAVLIGAADYYFSHVNND